MKDLFDKTIMQGETPAVTENSEGFKALARLSHLKREQSAKDKNLNEKFHIDYYYPNIYF
jgi:hypothetical protein